MAFDLVPRGSDQPEWAPQRELREPTDWGDLVLRVIVFVPLIGLYIWWVWGILGDFGAAFIARFFS